MDVETNGLARGPVRADRGRHRAGGRRGAARRAGSRSCGWSARSSRGIQRFTGITQQMVDTAPPAAEVLPALAELLDGRVLVAHNASFDSRVLRQAFERCGLDWPDPPVLCTVALGRQVRPAGRAGSGWRGWPTTSGSRSGETHRALPDALTCARIFCALFPKLCANAPTLARCRGARAPAPPRPARRRPGPIPREDRPDLSQLPDDPGVYVFRDERGRPLYVGKSVSLRSRARAHFCAPAGWTERAEVVDYRPTNSELGALVLENRLIKQWQPPGNRSLKRTDRYVYLRCRLDIPYPILEVDPEPAAGHAVNIGPDARPQGGPRARRPAQLAVQAAPVRAHAPAARAPVDLRPDGPLRLALPGRPRPERLPRASSTRRSGSSTRAATPASACSASSTSRSARPPTTRRYERAAALLRRRERLAVVLGRLEGMLRAVHDRPAPGAGRPPGQGALRRLLDRGGPGGRLGPAARLRGAGRAHRRRPAPGAARARPPCGPRRSTRCASWPPGWPSTSRRSWRSTRAPSPKQLLRFVERARPAATASAAAA